MLPSQRTGHLFGGAVASLGVLAFLAPAAQAGPFVPQQILNDPTTPGIGATALAVGPGGAAAIAYSKWDLDTGPFATKLFVSVHDQDARPTATSRRGFSVPEDLTEGRLPVQYDVGIDAAGNTTLFYWVGEDNEDFDRGDVYVRYRPSGGSWGEPQWISAQNRGFNHLSVQPRLVVAASGRAVLLTSAGLFERAPGATEFTALPGSESADQIAMNRWGDIAALFKTPDGLYTFPTLTVRIKPAGGAWSAARSLGPIRFVRDDREQEAAVAVTDNGTVYVAYSPGDPGDSSAMNLGLRLLVRKPGTSMANGTWQPTVAVPVGPERGWTGYAPRLEPYDNGAVRLQWLQAYGPNDSAGVPYEQIVPGGAAPAPATDFVDLAVSTRAGGRALATKSTGFSGNLKAYVRPKAGAPFGEAQTILTKWGNVKYLPGVAGLDDEGNGYIAYKRYMEAPSPGVPSSNQVAVSGYDPVPPKITSVAATPAVAGSPVALTAAATDRMSVPTFSWSFGDGTTGTGSPVSHIYPAAGTYTAKVTARDEAGNSTSWNKTIVVTAN